MTAAKGRPLSLASARRLALAAKGLGTGRPDRPTARHFRKIFDTLGLLQLDYVNVLVPAQQLIVWSRLGAYDRERLHDFVYRSGRCTEQWAHEASIVSIDHWPLLAHRRAAVALGQRHPLRQLGDSARYLRDVLEYVREHGASTAHDVPSRPRAKRKPGDWSRSMGRCALEHHFARGELVVTNRLSNFQRVYDLPERVLPADLLSESPSAEAAIESLVERAVRSLGVATLADIADYYRMSQRDAQPAVQRLAKLERIEAVAVHGWQETAWRAAGSVIPRTIPGASLLSPFDPVVWFRPRAERLFNFEYRIEIYVPAAKRRWGYYVLPFRLGDRIVARVDLKADRKAGRLLVQHAWVEADAGPQAVAVALSEELASLSDWLQLDAVRVRRHNTFSKQLHGRF